MNNRIVYLLAVILLAFVETASGQGTFTAIASGSWTTSGSWSHTGVDGDNIPDADDIATIPSGITITMPSGNQQIASLTIQSGGTLNMNNAGAVLDIFPSGGLLQVNLGGTIADNSTTTEINFFNTSSFIINGTVQADLLEFEGGGQTVTITGNGTLLVGRFNVNNIDITVTLNTTGSFGSNPNPFTVNSANFTIDGTGTINLGGGGDLNIGSSGVRVGCTMTISDDIAIIANSASLTILSGGTINVSNEFRVGPTTNDGDNFTLNVNNGGTLTVGTELQFNVGGGAGSGADDFTMDNAGTTTVSGNIDINSVTNADFSNSGTFTLSGGIINAPAANPATFTNGFNATLNLTGDIDNDVTRSFSANGNTVNYNATAAGQTIENPSASTYHHLTLSGAGNQTKTLSANTIVNGNLSIQNTAVFSVSTFSVSVAGNWLNSSTNADPFVQGAQTVTLNGTSAQSINNTGDADGTLFNSLTISNTFATPPQILANAAVTVASVLTMTSGNVNLNGNNFTISSTAAGALVHGLTSASGWMYGGSIIRTRPASTAFAVGIARSLFPLGSSGDWRPFFAGQSSNAGTAGTMTVSHTDATTTSVVAFAESIVRRHDSFWTVATSGISAGTWALRAGGTNFGTIEAGAADLRMSTSTTVVGTHAAGSGGPADWRVNRTGLAFGSLTNNFHVASTDAVNSPLPIELINFSAVVKNDIVELEWSTASELNNDFFTIERASDIEKFEPVGEFIGGKGTTRERNDYYIRDENPLYGRSYYRLKQTDFDGAFTYSPIEVVDYEGPRFSALRVYPNPSNGHSLTLVVNGLKEQTSVAVQIYNVQGQKVYDHLLEVSTPGTLKHDVEFGSPLKQGLYIIKAGQTLQLTQKIIVD